MRKTFFKYKTHPGDLLRDTSVVELPNPETDLQNFLLWFLPNYQSSDDIAYLDDLDKLLYDEFEEEEQKQTLLKHFKGNNKEKIKEEINLMELRLKGIAYKHFYELLLDDKIKIIA